MLVASVLITVNDTMILVLFAIILFVSQICLIMFDYSKGWDHSFHGYMDFWTIRGFIRNLIFNGNRAIIHTGQLSLAHYIGHIIIGLGLLEAIDYLENGNLAFAMTYACAYFIMAIIFSQIWRKWFNRGPAEPDHEKGLLSF